MHTKVESSSGRLPVKLLKAQVEFPHTFHDDKFRIQRVCQPINVEDKAVQVEQVFLIRWFAWNLRLRSESGKRSAGKGPK